MTRLLLPHNAFALIGAVMGLLFALITPPFQVPDEPAHFYRAYQVSELRLVPEKRLKPGWPYYVITVSDDGSFKLTWPTSSDLVLINWYIQKVLPEEQAGKMMDAVGRAIRTGEPQSFSFEGPWSGRSAYTVLLKPVDEHTVTGGIVPISDENAKQVGGVLPASLFDMEVAANGSARFAGNEKRTFDDIARLFAIPLNPAERSFLTLPNTALYSPVPYVPQAIGIAAGRLAEISPLLLLYAGRICNVAVWVFFVFLAIRLSSPGAAWILFILALTPMSVIQAGSVSADAATNWSFFLVVALVVRIVATPAETPPLGWPFLLGFSAVLTVCVLTKPVNEVALLLFLAIPAGRLGGMRRYLLTFLGMGIITMGALSLWSGLVKDMIFPVRFDVFISPVDQLREILASPLRYAQVLLETLRISGPGLLQGFIGRLGWVGTPLPRAVVVSYGLVLLAAACVGGPAGLGFRARAVFGMTFLLSAVGIATSMYFYFSDVGGPLVNGLQGRYFIASSPLLLFLVPSRRFRGIDRVLSRALPIYCTAVLLAGLHTVFHQYY